MTNEEAKFVLEKNMSIYDIRLNAAYNNAIEALEKQIPVKPKEFKGYPDNIFLCDKCGSTFVNGKHNKKLYCSNCGQRQLW